MIAVKSALLVFQLQGTMAIFLFHMSFAIWECPYLSVARVSKITIFFQRCLTSNLDKF